MGPKHFFAASAACAGFFLTLFPAPFIEGGLRQLQWSTPAFAEPVPANKIAATAVKRHAMSLIKPPKYPPDFTHFDYVNPDAPQGGTVRIGAFGSFDNLNLFTSKGQIAGSVGLLYDQLMDSSSDEPSTSYGLIAEWVTYPDDFSSATFKIRDKARWHDGKPITPEDVAFSLNAFKDGDPRYKFYYKNVKSVKKTGPGEVTFYFDVKGNRELPQIVSELTILPKHYWTKPGKDGKPRSITTTTLKPPLGSGPYKIKTVKPGKSLVYERVADYWAKDLAVRRGHYNFAKMRFEYYRDQQILFEAFKGHNLDFMTENNSKRWATSYKFPAVKQGKVIVEKIDQKSSQGMQGFAFNTRRAQFSDPRVRKALGMVFNFEWSNKNLFYGQYTRTDSYFENTELASSGLPKGRELELLNEVRSKVPGALFSTPFKNPVFNSPRDLRKAMGTAQALLKEAGWSIKNNKLVNDKSGEVLTMEFLLVSKAFERVVLPYIRNLAKLGVQATVRVVDSAQYQRRMQEFDFDMVVLSIGQSYSPGNEQREFFSTKAADRSSSRNYMGIKNPAVDHLIDKVIFATDRAGLIAATHALDRVLLWNHYIVPNWHVPYARVAYWRGLKHPKKMPGLRTAFPSIWWMTPNGDGGAEKVAAKNQKAAEKSGWLSWFWGVFQ